MRNLENASTRVRGAWALSALVALVPGVVLTGAAEAPQPPQAGLSNQPAASSPIERRSRPDQWLWDTPALKPQVTLFETGAIFGSPAEWSPDGRFLLLADQRPHSTRLVVVAADSPEPRTVVTVPGHILLARWSPDSKQIAYCAWPGPGLRSEILITDVSGARQFSVVKPPNLPTRLEWSPDGQRLAAAVARADASPEVWVWQLEGEIAQELCRIPTGGWPWLGDPVWSSDGTRVMVRQSWRASSVLPSVVVTDVNTGQPVRKWSGDWEPFSASPNLRCLVARSATELAVIEVGTGEVRPVMLGTGHASVPKEPVEEGSVCFGDSSAFALVQDRRLWIVDPTTGIGTPIGPENLPHYPVLDRSGPAGAIAYDQAESQVGPNGLYILDRPGGQPRPVPRDPVVKEGLLLGHGWDYAPNGKWAQRLFLMNVDLWDISKGYLYWFLLRDLRSGRVYHLTLEGWTLGKQRRIMWSPARSQALVWFDRGPSVLTLPE